MCFGALPPPTPCARALSLCPCGAKARYSSIALPPLLYCLTHRIYFFPASLTCAATNRTSPTEPGTRAAAGLHRTSGAVRRASRRVARACGPSRDESTRPSRLCPTLSVPASHAAASISLHTQRLVCQPRDRAHSPHSRSSVVCPPRLRPHPCSSPTPSMSLSLSLFTLRFLRAISGLVPLAGKGRNCQ
jgi:hypothetical protein